MSNYTTVCYGVGDSHKGGDHSYAGNNNAQRVRHSLSHVNKGKKSTRLVVAASNNSNNSGVNIIEGGVIYVNKDTVLAQNDQLILYVQDY